MGLLVWLPLNGNVENKGASAAIITNHGAAVNTSGKIGSCYSFDGSDDYISIVDTNVFNLFKGGSTPFSITMWVYHSDSTRAILFGDYSTTGSINFNVELTTDHKVRFYWSGSPDHNTGVNIGASTWSHVAVTYDGSTLTTYLNGTSKNTRSGTLADRNKTTGEFRLGRDGRTGSTVLNGRLNDFRLYSHCLSAAEVHEISQGLVLHYKLDSQYAETTTNLITSLGNYTRMTINNNKAYIDWSTNTGDTYIFFNTSEAMSASNIYSFSFQCEGLSSSEENTISFGWANLGGNYRIFIHNGWNKLENFSPPSNELRTFFDDYNRNSSSKFTLYNFQLEKKDHATGFVGYGVSNVGIIQDSSGYGHNGTISGSLTLTSETPRYSACTSINNSAAVITTSNNYYTGDTKFSFNIWAKPSSLPAKAKYFNIRLNNSLLFNFGCTSGGGTNCQFLIFNGTNYKGPNGAFQIPLNEWHMWTGTYDGTTVKLYKDGTLLGSWTSATNYSLTIQDRGSILGYDGAAQLGLASDARIYCTTLSDADVKSLYEVGARVGNKGDLHIYEAKEHMPNIIFKADSARVAQVFQDGLSRYTQANCQVTLTDQGYHIYRPPNYNPTNNGNTMWGGLKIVNQTSDTIAAYNAARDNIWGLTKGHTYLFAFHAKGKSSNSPTLNVQNNMGWDRIAGMGPNPTYVARNTIPANFNGEQDCYAIFTIGDDIVKTATETKGGYTSGTQYLSYRQLCLNYGYTDTGALGTDIYLTNFRLYDITSYKAQFTKYGVANFYDFVEDGNLFKIRKNSEVETSTLIEF